jgi:hypothetical protein
MAALVALGLTAGCGGMAASHSVSPASFFLPGLIRSTPSKPPLDAPVATNAAPVLAAAH